MYCKWLHQGMLSSFNIGSVNFVLVLKLTPVLFWTGPKQPLREKVNQCLQNIQALRCFRKAYKLYFLYEILN